MLSFKDYLLTEDIFAKNGELFAAVNDSALRKPSTPTNISTNLRPLGKQTGMTRGTSVYYAYSYKSNDEPGGSTELLKSFKGKGPFKFPDGRRSTFLSAACAHMASEFKKMGMMPDVIVTPQSSSGLAADFANALGDHLGVATRKIGAFKKAAGAEISDDKDATTANIIAKHVDMEHFDEKFSGDEKTRQSTLKDLVSSIRNNIKKNGHIVAKDIYKPYLKFVKNIVEPDLQGDDEYSLMEKHVMVVDDILSSGGTMSDLFRACRELGASSVFGCTLFARTGS